MDKGEIPHGWAVDQPAVEGTGRQRPRTTPGKASAHGVSVRVRSAEPPRVEAASALRREGRTPAEGTGRTRDQAVPAGVVRYPAMTVIARALGRGRRERRRPDRPRAVLRLPPMR